MCCPDDDTGTQNCKNYLQIVFFLHAFCTKTRLVKQSLEQVLHHWVSRIVVAVKI